VITAGRNVGVALAAVVAFGAPVAALGAVGHGGAIVRARTVTGPRAEESLISRTGAASATRARGKPVPARDRFTGAIDTVMATGSYEGDNGKVKLHLVPTTSSRSPRRVAVVIASVPCHHFQGCLPLHGTLTGTMTLVPATIPDTGARATLDLSGQIAPMHKVTAHGTVQGTGFIYRGHETLTLTLTNRRGSVTVDARSALVPGFTMP
jgi:hypothetical protein